MTMETELRVINDYLARLEAAARVLPPDRRAELLSEIREHIDSARAENAGRGEAATRAVLDRLGPPEEIVAAAGEDPFGGSGPRPAPAPRGMAWEIAAVLLMTVGSVLLPALGWLVGLVLMWSSDRWTVREKLLGTFVIPGGLGLFVVLGLLGAGVESCFETTVSSSDGPATTSSTCDSGFSWLGQVVRPGLLLLLGVAALVVPFYLLHRARRRATLELAAGHLV